MKRINLGEFEEIALLTVLVLGEEAYGVTIKAEINKEGKRSISRGALHTALSRLEEKGFLTSHQGDSNEDRRGMPKRYYQVTNKGKLTLQDARATRENLWDRIPSIRMDLQYV
jgi:PadR family transcriptional regulator